MVVFVINHIDEMCKNMLKKKKKGIRHVVIFF